MKLAVDSRVERGKLLESERRFGRECGAGSDLPLSRQYLIQVGEKVEPSLMAKSPWFKFYCSDYLTDDKVSFLPLEAQGILVRMWAALWNLGKLPSDVESLSRVCGVSVLHMQKHMQNLMQMFVKDADGFLFSERMDRERERSERISFVRKLAAEAKHSKDVPANGHAKRSAKVPANGHAKLVDHSQKSDSDINTKPNTTPFCLEPPTETPKQEPVIHLTLNDSSEYPLYPSQVSEWKKLYPAVNVSQELRSMRGWCISNPSKRKTKTGILRFVNSWLAKAQDRGGSSGLLPEPEERPVLSVSEKLRARAAGVTQ